jgi:hypothetical protein
MWYTRSPWSDVCPRVPATLDCQSAVLPKTSIADPKQYPDRADGASRVQTGSLLCPDSLAEGRGFERSVLIIFRDRLL